MRFNTSRNRHHSDEEPVRGVLARIYDFPSADSSSPTPGDHPATFEEYLASQPRHYSVSTWCFSRWAFGSSQGRFSSLDVKAFLAGIDEPPQAGIEGGWVFGTEGIIARCQVRT